MMAVELQIQSKALKQLTAICKEMGRSLPKEMAVAVNKAAKKCESIIAKDIVKKVALKQKDVKEVLKTTKANARNPGASVTLRKSDKLGLNKYGAKQNAAGVTFKIDKQGGRGFVQSAFQGPRPGAMKLSWRGNAFKRTTKKRLPIVKLTGPSPWGVHVKNNFTPATTEATLAELNKQILERIRFLKLKQSGAI